MTPWVKRLLFANVAVFVLAPPPLGVLGALPIPFVDSLVLVPAELLERPWSVLTYQFLHYGTMHLVFNMLGLFFLGPQLEARIGSRHFLALYLTSGVVGGLLSLTTPNVPIVGASAAVYGVMFGFARYWPRVRFLIWGILPVEAWAVVVFLVAASLLGGMQGSGNIAHFAHLGGFLGGWLYLKWFEWSSPARKFRRKVEAVAPARPGGKDLKLWEEVDLAGLHPLNREEYLRVLEKARLVGPASLTFQERAFLERFAGRP